MATVGLRGDKLFDGTWGYDGGFHYNNIKVTQLASVHFQLSSLPRF